MNNGSILSPVIVCAAEKLNSGIIICSPRHRDKTFYATFELLTEENKTLCTHGKSVQGFVDQYGNFYTREEALVIAKENNQIARRCGGDEHRLFSENLY